jgi:hypothetical protein
MSTPRYAADVFAGLMAELEAYGDAFERLATTQEQAQLARQFQQLISTLPAQLLAAVPAPNERHGPRDALFEQQKTRKI